MGCGSSKTADAGNELPVRTAKPTTGAAPQAPPASNQRPAQSGAAEKTAQPPNPIVYFDMTQGGKPLGRITMELFQDVVPATTENFRRFCTGEVKDNRGQPQGYKGSMFHRVIPNFMCQGGDFVNGDGTGRTSIYNPGGGFDDENFTLRHTTPGMLSMANSGPNTNGCQFFLTTTATPHLDGKHVVFGKVIDGMNVVKTIEGTRTDNRDKPVSPVVVADCGQLNNAGVPIEI